MFVALSLGTGWAYLEWNYDIDYGGIVEVLKDEVTGRESTCLDVGEEWRNIPRCRAELSGE